MAGDRLPLSKEDHVIVRLNAIIYVTSRLLYSSKARVRSEECITVHAVNCVRLGSCYFRICADSAEDYCVIAERTTQCFID